MKDTAQELEAETWRQNLKRSWRSTAYWLVPSLLAHSIFLYIPGPLPGVAWALPHQQLIRKYPNNLPTGQSDDNVTPQLKLPLPG